MKTKKIGEIIFAKVLEMPIKKFLIYIKKAAIDLIQFPVMHETLKEKLVYAKITMKNGELRFLVSDGSLQKTHPILQNNDDKIVCSLKWINTRNRFSLHILQSLLHSQREYWISGKEAALKPLTFRQFLSWYPLKHLDQSRLSRLVANLLVITLRTQIVGLRSLFISKKKYYSYRIREIVDSSEDALKDKDIKCLLNQKKIHISVRTICNCRKLLNIKNYKERAAHYYGRGIVFSDYINVAMKKNLIEFHLNPGYMN